MCGRRVLLAVVKAVLYHNLWWVECPGFVLEFSYDAICGRVARFIIVFRVAGTVSELVLGP
jgi:hypothetical protein